ncbi:MAG: DUF1491 family protein [Alphaproteobacteria bacterium]|nr:DUF1491 family protein [Alphaproteobacteria bacterium]
MQDGRLPTELWVQAHVRRCTVEAVPVYVLRKGDPHGGMLMLKLNQGNTGCRVLTQTRDVDGALAWLAAMSDALVSEEEADSYIARAVDRDPDLWVVEVEHPQGWHPFEGKVL